MMEKIIKMPYSEYESILETIKKQDEALNKFIKADNVVIIDFRKSLCRNHIENYVVPEITANNTDLATYFMQEEFNKTQRELDDYIRVIGELNEHIRLLQVENDTLKKLWWEKLFN